MRASGELPIADVSTHSRAEAAAYRPTHKGEIMATFQHTAARRRLQIHQLFKFGNSMFQHTAARRRLLPT